MADTRLDLGWVPRTWALPGPCCSFNAHSNCQNFCLICGNETVTPDLIRGPGSAFLLSHALVGCRDPAFRWGTASLAKKIRMMRFASLTTSYWLEYEYGSIKDKFAGKFRTSADAVSILLLFYLE